MNNEKLEILEWDTVGYPTEDTLKIIEKWRGEDFREFFALLKPVWKYSQPGEWCGWMEEDGKDLMDRTVRRYFLSTGGWSGNESLISAMQDNYVLWSLTWVQTRRGGHYIFEVVESKPPTSPV